LVAESSSVNVRLGYDLVSIYMFIPYLPTLTTLYLINHPVHLPWYVLLPICITKALGYVIYR
jgi:hypothetical protein